MMIWASVYSISVKFCRCNVIISPAVCSTIFVGRRLNGFHKLLALRISTAFGDLISYHLPFALKLVYV